MENLDFDDRKTIVVNNRTSRLVSWYMITEDIHIIYTKTIKICMKSDEDWCFFPSYAINLYSYPLYYQTCSYSLVVLYRYRYISVWCRRKSSRSSPLLNSDKHNSQWIFQKMRFSWIDFFVRMCFSLIQN